ncbi:F-box protein PP2-B10 [Cajanus cajan]|uniref:F-box protein PP2-B10 n=1 Tax=Cajanus cajan TaxID=3821 RepID=A0A151U5S3_CAJCA|nr:F-box protein PP2-B10 [Cajanus cajan]KYP74581.1 F-box protein PP2-B10 [Cajanus cajan]
MEELPEGCMAHILSYTSTPVDVFRLSLASKAFLSAAEYDTVWERFLPSDLSSIISPSSFPSSNSKKDLYFALCDRPTIIHQGKRSFQLEKRTGNKCYMLSATDLYIVWAPPPAEISQYWEWTSLPDSRFEQVARLYAVCWLDINGNINMRVLSPNTHYAAFLVFKMIDASGFHHAPVALSVGIVGGSSTSKYVCLDPNLEDDELDERFWGLERPNVRSDGWLEIEMGEFFNSGLEEDKVHMAVRETESNMWKHGFILEGIEVRPKHVSSAICN